MQGKAYGQMLADLELNNLPSLEDMKNDYKWALFLRHNYSKNLVFGHDIVCMIESRDERNTINKREDVLQANS